MRAIHDRSTTDRETTDMSVYAPEQIGRTQYLTPHGFLYCEGVRIARTGPMLYKHSEVPEVSPSPDGAMTVVIRDAETLFAPETLASFNGQAITDDHPTSLIRPDSPSGLTKGTVLNPRRGEGVDSEHLVVDFLIRDKKLIQDVQDKKKFEVSPGYDADVEEIKPGIGRQTKIIGNHVAIVLRGRGGSSCAIQDESPINKEPIVAKAKNSLLNSTFMNRIRKAFKDADEGALEEALAGDGEPDGDEGVQRIVISVEPTAAAAPAAVVEDDDPNETRFKAIEDNLEGLKTTMDAIAAKMDNEGHDPNVNQVPEVKDEEAKEEDEPAKSEETMDAVSKAEVIMPGFKAGTMDSAKGSTLTSMRRDVLTRAFADSARRAPIEAVCGKAPDFAAMKPRQLRATFDGVAALARASNNVITHPRHVDVPQGPMTAARLQEINAAARRKAHA